MSAPDHERVALAFGAVLKLARTGAQLTQEKLAELADIDRTTPSLYERGLRQPTIGMLITLGRALGIEPPLLVAMTLARLRREVPQ
jgi:XRE family transcriptional regulator, regulator of sulfur utilization